MPKNRKLYPSDVSDEQRVFVVPYLALLREDALQRAHDLREVFTPCARSCVSELPAACYRTIFRRGRQFPADPTMALC